MTDKELNDLITCFVKLNPKNLKYPNISNKRINAFLTIQGYFKKHRKDVNHENYDYLFFNNNKSLSGQQWLEILLSTKNYTKYYKLIKMGYPYCDQKNLKQKLLLELFYWRNVDTQEAMIEIAEVDFSNEQRSKLIKLRNFISEEDWSNYFYNLQLLVHEQIINLLEWKSDLNWSNYNKPLTKQMDTFLEKTQTIRYLEFIQKVNFYRNTLSKAKPTENSASQELNKKWVNSSPLNKLILVWEFYHDLNNFINTVNLFIQQKRKLI